jgi:CDP-diacylglycerol--serine O-phosphatidyltransferase
MEKSNSTAQVDHLVKSEPSQVMKALPNLFTLAALASGMSAIMFVIDEQFAYAVACLVVAMFLDACDGRVARFVGTSSKFGAELDSLSDVVCFGAAPALLLYKWGLDQFPFAGWLVCIVLASATALRLARFNVAISAPDKPSWSSAFFQGVPSPAGAFLSLFPFYLSQSGQMESSTAQMFVAWLVGRAWHQLDPCDGAGGSRILGRFGRRHNWICSTLPTGIFTLQTSDVPRLIRSVLSHLRRMAL